jgi:hypothetical protein
MRDPPLVAEDVRPPEPAVSDPFEVQFELLMLVRLSVK